MNRSWTATALIVVACGGVVDGTDYARQLAEIRATVEQHRDAVTAEGALACASEMDHYRGLLSPQLGRLERMSGELRGCPMMQSSMMGASASGDGELMGVCSELSWELATHETTACSAGVDAVAETNRHCDAMDAMLAHAQARQQLIEGGMTCMR